MVLEHLFSEDWLLKKNRYAFVMGLVYSVLGILLARILFPADPALPAVAFTSLLMLPELYKLFSIEEKLESREEDISLGTVLKVNADLYKTYISLFFGILVAYIIASTFLPALEVNTLFQKQLDIRASTVTGGALSMAVFQDLLINNMWVLLAIFIMSLLAGDGAVFLVTWNASVWGTIIGFTVRNASQLAYETPLLFVTLLTVITLPHLFLEATSYILAAISGGVISKDFIKEDLKTERFRMVFNYNFILFLVAVVILVLSVLLEVFVIGSSERYMEVVRMAIG